MELIPSKSINIISNNSRICSDCIYQYDYNINNCKDNKVKRTINLIQNGLNPTNKDISIIQLRNICIENDNNKMNSNVIFKNNNYILYSINIVKKSINKYNNTIADSELILTHITSDFKNILFVCIPIIISNTETSLLLKSSSQTNILSKIINLSKNINKNVTLDIDMSIEMIEEININDLIPSKKYYIYEDINENRDKNTTTILFDKNDSSIKISQEDYNTLSSIINYDIINKNYITENIVLNVSDKEPIFIGSGANIGGFNIINPFLSSSTQGSIPINNNSSIKNEETNWLGFLVSVVIIIIFVILWSLFGINLCYFTTLSKTDLDKLFPTDENKVPYSNIGNINIEFTDIKNNIYTIDKIIKSTKLNKYGFPYSWKETINFIHPKFFIGNSVFKSYINGRNFIKYFFEFFKSFEDIGKIILFILTPIILCLFIFIIPILSYCITFIGQFSAGILSSFIAFIFAIFVSLPFIVSIIQTIQLFVTLFLIPFMINNKKMEMISERLGLIILISSILISISSFSTLGSIYGISISISLLISNLYFWWNNNMNTNLESMMS